MGFGIIDLDRAPAPGTPSPPPGRVILFETTFADLPPLDPENPRAFITQVTLSGSGRIDLDFTVDWGSPTNNLDVFLYQGHCDGTDLPSDECPQLASSTTQLKPEVLRLERASAGSYSLVVVNFGTTSESGTIVIGGTTSASAAATQAQSSWEAAGEAAVRPLRPGAHR